MSSLSKVALTATLGGMSTVLGFRVADSLINRMPAGKVKATLKKGNCAPEDARNFFVGAIVFSGLDFFVHHYAAWQKAKVNAGMNGLSGFYGNAIDLHRYPSLGAYTWY